MNRRTLNPDKYIDGRRYRFSDWRGAYLLLCSRTDVATCTCGCARCEEQRRGRRQREYLSRTCATCAVVVYGRAHVCNR